MTCPIKRFCMYKLGGDLGQGSTAHTFPGGIGLVPSAEGRMRAYASSRNLTIFLKGDEGPLQTGGVWDLLNLAAWQLDFVGSRDSVLQL